MGRWVSTVYDVLDGVPPVPGVYVTFQDDGSPSFVGSSINLKRTLCAIRKDLVHCRSDWSTVKYSRSRTVGDWLFRELRLKSRLQPKHNVSPTWHELKVRITPTNCTGRPQSDLHHKHRSLFGKAVETVLSLREQGHTWNGIVARLNRLGYASRQGNRWTYDSVRAVYRTYAYPYCQ